MKIILAILAIVTAATAQGVPPCMFQTAHAANAALYTNNPITHDDLNNGSVYTTQLKAAYQVLGNGGLIFDGPTFFVTTPCFVDRITYRTADSAHLDQYHYHYVCGAGPFVGQGDTVTTTAPATQGGLCGAGGYDVQLINTYDLGIYCEGGGCNYGQLYASLGPIPYNVFYAVGPTATATLLIKQGPVVLPSGLYGGAMGGNCDAGSVPGVAQGTGDTLCGELAGEASNDTSSPTGGWNGTGSEWYPHKFFTLTSGTSGNQHCLLYDPSGNYSGPPRNNIGLPANLTTYDNGGCARVDTGVFLPNVLGTGGGTVVTWASPHAAHFAIMGTAQSIVTGASKINVNTKLATGTSIH
jgi:hypothetical protein